MPDIRPKLIVHLGQSKTGSTTLQNMFSKSREALMREGIFYPRAGFYGHHSRLLAYLSDGRDIPPFHLRAFDGDREKALDNSRMLWERLRTYIGKQQPHTVILSSEMLYEFAPRDVELVDILIGHLQKLSDDITLVVYLRAPADRFLSLKQEGLKHGDPATFPAPQRDYEDGLKPYHAYPDIKLDVHHFARETLQNGDIAADFAHKYLPTEARAKLIWPSRELNTTLSPEMMAICEEITTGAGPVSLNRRTTLVGAFAQYLAEVDDAVPGKTRPRYKPGIARAIHESNLDLDWLSETHGITFAAPEAEGDTAEINLDDLTTVRSLCYVDEERYARLVNRVPGPFRFKLIQETRPMAEWIAKTPKRFRRNLQRLLAPLSGR